MAKTEGPRAPARLSDQDLVQSLIQAITNLRTLPQKIDTINTSVDQIVAELHTTNTHLSVLSTEAPKQTQALQDCLKGIEQTYTAEGGAGLITTADRATVFTVTNAWGNLGNYDAKQLPEVDATADQAAGTITINATGIWAVSFSMDLTVLPDVSNNTRYIEIGLYNTIDDSVLVIGSVPIPRYGDRATLYGTLRFIVDADNLSEPLIIAVRTPAGALDVNVTDVHAGAQFSCGRELTRVVPA